MDNDGGKLIALAGALNIFADTENFILKKKNLKIKMKKQFHIWKWSVRI